MTTIVLLNCSTSWCQSKSPKGGVEPDAIPSTGYVEQTDSLVTIPISFIKIANSKMVELNYEKEINTKLKEIIANDSLIVSGLSTELNNCAREADIKIRKIRKERNIFIGVSAGVSVLFLLLMLR